MVLANWLANAAGVLLWNVMTGDVLLASVTFKEERSNVAPLQIDGGGPLTIISGNINPPPTVTEVEEVQPKDSVLLVTVRV